MAQQTPLERKEALRTALELERVQLSRALNATGEDLNVPARMKRSFEHQKTAWIIGAALTGWLISRIPRRKAKKPTAPLPPGLQASGHAAVGLAVLKILFNASKPFLTALLARKISQMSGRR